MTLSSRARAHACGAHLSYPRGMVAPQAPLRPASRTGSPLGGSVSFKVSYPRGMVALDPASVLLDGLPLDAISTWAPALLGVQGSVLSGRGC